MTVHGVCSAKTRASTQKGPKGNQWWRREAWHVRGADGKTLCGRDCADYLDMGDLDPNSDLCTKCNKRLEKQAEEHIRALWKDAQQKVAPIVAREREAEIITAEIMNMRFR